MPGLTDAKNACCPGPVSRPSKSVNTTSVDKPSTGPNAAAKFMSRVVNRPVLRTVLPSHSIRPSPDTAPSTLAITPKVKSVSISGCNVSSKRKSSTASKACPLPLPSTCRISTSATLRPVFGSVICPIALMILFSNDSIILGTDMG